MLHFSSAMNDLHEVVFVWPDTRPQDVILTGSFDQWTASMHMTKATGGFEGKVKVPWGTRIPYKFIVDGIWMTLQSQPQEPDSLGNLNNIYDSPLKPQEIPAPKDETHETQDEAEDTSEKQMSTRLPTVSSETDVASLPVDSPDSNPGDTPEDPIVLPALDAVPVTESTALPPPDIHSVVKLTTLPPATSSPVVEAETIISPEPVHPTISPEPENPPPVMNNEPISSAVSDIDSKAIEPASSGKNPDAIQFPLSELASQSSPTSNDPKSSVELPKPEKLTTPTESLNSEPKTPSFVPSSAPSSPAGPLRGMFHARQRSVSSKSGSVRSESSRSKRHSLFGKVKHLFHLDKDS